MDFLLFLVVFLVVFTVARVMTTPLHELGHIIAAKLVGVRVSEIVWLAPAEKFHPIIWKNFVGHVCVDVPVDKMKFRGIIDLAGGMLTASILIPGGIILVLFFNPAIGLACVVAGGAEFFYGLTEGLWKKRRRHHRRVK